MRDKDWEIIKTLYEKKSITQAAESLFLTQSALTRRLHAIEEELGTELVTRSSKGISFTEAGRYLFQKSTIFCDFMDEVHTYLKSGHKKKELVRLGVPNSFARLHMSKPLKDYTDHHNKVQIQVLVNSSDVIIQQLMDDVVDVGIICGDYTFLGDKARLFDEQLFILTPMNTRLDDVIHLPLIESYHNPLVKMIFDQWWKLQFGNFPQSTWQVPYSDIAIEMVEHGLGICFLFGADWRINDEQVQRIPIYDKEGKPVLRAVWLMWSERCDRNPEMLEFVHFLEKHFKTIH